MNLYKWFNGKDKQDNTQAFKEKVAQLQQEKDDLIKTISNLELSNMVLESKLNNASIGDRPFIEAKDSNTYFDPAPKEGKKRESYIAKVAGFHKNVMGEKILAKIAEVRMNLEGFANTTAQDMQFKGTINGLWLMYDWGQYAVSEHTSNLEGDDEEVENILV